MIKLKSRLSDFTLINCLLLILFLSLTSCISRKKLNYFQDAAIADTMTKAMQKVQKKKIQQINIRPYDILDIRVSTPVEQTNKLFNEIGGQQSRGGGQTGSGYRIGYSVSQEGTVDLPLIGEVNVLNLSIPAAENLIEEKLSEYVRDPYVQVKFLNYKVFVLGEVKNPGMITINNESATIMEALSMAGGLGQFARRTNVRVFRGTPNNPIVHQLDLTSISSMNSPGYFLEPYDIIYVEPLRRKTILTNINTINAIVGILNTAISLTLIFLTSNRL